MNIEVQCCGVAILILLWIFYLRQKPLGLYSVKLFLTTMGATSFCIIMDIVSIIAINHSEQISPFLLAFICKTYIISLAWVGYFELLYSRMDFSDSVKKQRKLNIVYTVVIIIGSIVIYSLPIYYYLDENVVYTYGPSCIATYILALMFILITLYKVIIQGKKMNAKRRRAIIIWMIIWITAAIIQFLDAELLLVGFASVLGMVILFFELENPEANLDRETNAYSSHALVEYMKQFFERKETFSAILLSLSDTSKEHDDNDNVQTGMVLREIVSYLEKMKNVKVFKSVGREFVLIFNNEERMQEVFLLLKERFNKPWEDINKEKTIFLNPYYMLLMNSSMAKNEDEIFQMFRYFSVERKKTDKHIIILDEKKIAKLREKEKSEKIIFSAIEEDRIEVFYQPIYSTKKRSFVSAEALVRIREKDGSIVPPGLFIPVAEENGVIAQIGEIVFEKTCAFIKENNLRDSYGIDYVEINLSVKQCEKKELAATFIEIMKKYDLDPSCINLEITESASIEKRHIFLENMQTLLDYGVEFSLDDFGSGESNLNYIVEMPVSIVKFDQTMSRAYFADQKAKFVMEAAMNMIHDLKLKIVSEGVETKEQMETIVGLGIDYIQGYYFSKPLPGDEFLKFVKAGVE